MSDHQKSGSDPDPGSTQGLESGRSRGLTPIQLAVAVLVVAALSWLIVRALRPRGPYSVDAAALSGWTLVTGEPGGPALIALQPPPQFSAALFQQVSQRTGLSLVAPSRPSVPLVLQTEYEESLQGVWSVDDIMRLARETGLDGARFEPVCLGLHTDSRVASSGQLFFVVFQAPAFVDFRQRLTPLFPEHGGSGTFDPPALRPILTIAATDRGFARWWPITVNQQSDCQASLRTN